LTTGSHEVDVSGHLITDADAGAVYSWQAKLMCGASGTTGSETLVAYGCSTTPENHRTTVTAGAIESDVVWIS
jgi:hypothetical protein